MKFGVHIIIFLLVACFEVSASQDLTEDSKPSFIISALCTIRGKLVKECVNELQSLMMQTLYSHNSFRKRMKSAVSSEDSVKMGLPNKRRRDEMDGFYSNW
ncbi:uncharacterized protein LOC121373810 [Gigantopelta aegis]|uniref:uncharacterized protein LOC121373810 n=1 Tax=Gigantopelta aegis TaxID=1735272 RepID=UPI001B88DC6A|nr:uncharacterized protein LOC121373810 [Gigantopelta aegis]